MSHPLISTTTTTQATFGVATAKINTIYIVGTVSGGTLADNTISDPLASSTEFNTIVGANSGSAPSFRFMRAVDNAVPIRFVNGKSAIGGATLKDHLIAGLTLIGKNLQLVPGILVIPELALVTVPADVLAVYNAAQNLVANPLMNWQYFHNSPQTANTKALYLADKATLASADGHSAYFAGYGRDADNNQIPLAVFAAAKMMQLNRSFRGYFAPAAYQNAIPFRSVDVGFLPRFEIGVNEYDELLNANINTIYRDGNNFTLLGTRTLSANRAWRHINTRYAANDIAFRTSEVLKPYLFMPSDTPSAQITVPAQGTAEANANADIFSALIDLLNTIKRDGAFTANIPTQDNGSVPEAYDITTKKLASGDLALTVGLWLVESRERIQIGFVKRG